MPQRRPSSLTTVKASWTATGLPDSTQVHTQWLKAISFYKEEIISSYMQLISVIYLLSFTYSFNVLNCVNRITELLNRDLHARQFAPSCDHRSNCKVSQLFSGAVSLQLLDYMSCSCKCRNPRLLILYPGPISCKENHFFGFDSFPTLSV